MLDYAQWAASFLDELLKSLQEVIWNAIKSILKDFLKISPQEVVTKNISSAFWKLMKLQLLFNAEDHVEICLL